MLTTRKTRRAVMAELLLLASPATIRVHMLTGEHEGTADKLAALAVA